MVLRFDLPQINEIKNLIVNPGFPREVFRFSVLVLPGLMLLFRARDLLLALAPAAFPQVAIQRSSMSLVRLSTLFGKATCALLESSITSLRHDDHCTHTVK